MKTQEDVYKRVAEQSGYSVEMVKFVVKNFWKSVHYYLSHPLACGRGIIFQKGFVMKPRPLLLGRQIAKLEARNEAGFGDDYTKAKQYYLTEVAKYIIEHEEPAGRRIVNARLSLLPREKERYERIKDYRARNPDHIPRKRYRRWYDRPGEGGQGELQQGDK